MLAIIMMWHFTRLIMSEGLILRCKLYGYETVVFNPVRKVSLALRIVADLADAGVNNKEVGYPAYSS